MAIARVSWDEPDPSNTAGTLHGTGILLEFVAANKFTRTMGIVMTQGGFKEVPIAHLRFDSWCN